MSLLWVRLKERGSLTVTVLVCFKQLDWHRLDRASIYDCCSTPWHPNVTGNYGATHVLCRVLVLHAAVPKPALRSTKF